MSADDQLDRVGDDLAADERRLHPLGSHRHAVADRDRVELHRGPAGRPDPGLDVLGQATLVVVARHRLDPVRRHPDERLGEVLVGEPDRLEHGARGCAVGAVGQRRGMALGGVGCGRRSRHLGLLVGRAVNGDGLRANPTRAAGPQQGCGLDGHRRVRGGRWRTRCCPTSRSGVSRLICVRSGHGPRSGRGHRLATDGRRRSLWPANPDDAAGSSTRRPMIPLRRGCPVARCGRTRRCRPRQCDRARV